MVIQFLQFPEDGESTGAGREFRDFVEANLVGLKLLLETGLVRSFQHVEEVIEFVGFRQVVESTEAGTLDG